MIVSLTLLVQCKHWSSSRYEWHSSEGAELDLTHASWKLALVTSGKAGVSYSEFSRSAAFTSQRRTIDTSSDLLAQHATQMQMSILVKDEECTRDCGLPPLND